MKVNGSSWKFVLLFFSGIIIAAQLLFIIHWRWQYWQSQHWKEELPPNWVAVEVAGDHRYPIPLPIPTVFVNGTSALLQKPLVQELICPRDQKVQRGCYVVVDGPDRLTGSGFSRFLAMEPANQLTLAEVSLKFPLHYNFTRENARQWPVLTDRVPTEYQKVAVAQPFLTQTFAPSLTPKKVPDGKKRRILCLGLRGSAVNNFFANLSTKYDVTVVEPEPALRYMADKWFGFEETEHHRIFLENPAFYVSARARLIENPNTVKVPKRFDFILVDICYGLGSKTPGKCPVAEFESEAVVADLAKNLADNGTVVVHFFSATSKSENHQLANHEHQVLQIYKKYLRNCYFLSLGPDLMLTCSRRAPMTRTSYLMAFRNKLPKELQMFAKKEEPKFFLDLEAV